MQHNDEHKRTAEEKLFDTMLEELHGAATPPDRVEAILRRHMQRGPGAVVIPMASDESSDDENSSDELRQKRLLRSMAGSGVAAAIAITLTLWALSGAPDTQDLSHGVTAGASGDTDSTIRERDAESDANTTAFTNADAKTAHDNEFITTTEGTIGESRYSHVTLNGGDGASLSIRLSPAIATLDGVKTAQWFVDGEQRRLKQGWTVLSKSQPRLATRAGTVEVADGHVLAVRGLQDANDRVVEIQNLIASIEAQVQGSGLTNWERQRIEDVQNWRFLDDMAFCVVLGQVLVDGKQLDNVDPIEVLSELNFQFPMEAKRVFDRRDVNEDDFLSLDEALAGKESMPEAHRNFIEEELTALDHDDDGVLSRKEFDGAPVSLRMALLRTGKSVYFSSSDAGGLSGDGVSFVFHGDANAVTPESVKQLRAEVRALGEHVASMSSEVVSSEITFTTLQSLRSAETLKSPQEAIRQLDRDDDDALSIDELFADALAQFPQGLQELIRAEFENADSDKSRTLNAEELEKFKLISVASPSQKSD